MEGTVALQQGEDAVVLRQRSQNGVVRFFVSEERQHLRLPDADRGALIPRGGRAASAAGRPAAAESVLRGRGARAAQEDAARRCRARGEILRGDFGLKGGCAGAWLPR